MLVVHPPAALFPFVVWILSKRDCVCTWRTVASYSCCVIHTGNTREDTEGNFLSFSYCEAESQISKLLGAFLLSISKPVKSTGEPNTRMPAEHGLKNGTQIISVISLCCPISDRKVVSLKPVRATSFQQEDMHPCLLLQCTQSGWTKS